MVFDVIVVGAGMVGVSTALHLQKLGQSVLLVDRRQPGEETSHGNAGIIEQDGHVPVTIPREIIPLLKYASNRQIAMHYHISFMPKLLPWLFRMWLLSNPNGIESYAQRVAPLRAQAAKEHFALADQANIRDAFRETGWIHLYHSADSFAEARLALDYAEQFDTQFDLLDFDALQAFEPAVNFGPEDQGIFWKQCVSVSSPKRVTKAYGDLFLSQGGAFRLGDGRSLRREDDWWVIDCAVGAQSGRSVVLAMGPWTMDLLGSWGYRMPFAVKRGYHQHFSSKDGAVLNRPIVDEEIGFLLTPMEDGIRLTSGIEFADRDAHKTPVQLYRATEWARELYPLGAPVEDEPWMGSRPCFPDSLPVIEKAKDHPDLYLNFGHGHMGFGSGPATGRMMAEIVVGKEPVIDPSGFSSSRF